MVITTVCVSHVFRTWIFFDFLRTFCCTLDNAENPSGRNCLVVLCLRLSCPGIRDVRVNLSISRQSRMGERPEKTSGWHFLEGLLRPLANTSLDAWLAPKETTGDSRIVVWCGHSPKWVRFWFISNLHHVQHPVFLPWSCVKIIVSSLVGNG